MSVNQRNVPENSTITAGDGQRKRTDTFSRQRQTTRRSTDVAKVERIGLFNFASYAILVGPLVYRLALFQVFRQLSV